MGSVFGVVAADTVVMAGLGREEATNAAVLTVPQPCGQPLVLLKIDDAIPEIISWDPNVRACEGE